MRYLAIDPGDKRTGLAVGDDETNIVTPIGAIVHGSDNERLALLRKAVEQQQPDALVVGLPLNMDDTEGPAARKARALGDQLRDVFDLPVHLVDERLTSYQADQQMSQSGLTHAQKKARRDALAAAAILRDFLEQKRE
jgi:putative Holliday junction resolvase